MKVDLGDRLAAGESAQAIAEGAPKYTRTPPVDPSFDLRPAAVRLSEEESNRREWEARLLSFGIPFLDEALGGITPGDLVLIGAKSNAGKTQLASLIAMANARKGKRIGYFALEADCVGEIERRMRFKFLADLYYENRLGSAPLRYQDWVLGRAKNLVESFEAEAKKKAEEALANVSTSYPNDDFTADHFLSVLRKHRGRSDLLVLDHLHYVAIDDQNENRGMKAAVTKIKKAVRDSGVPALIVAHVRKSDSRSDALLPKLEDFSGSSDIGKIASKSIMIGPAQDRADPRKPYLFPTLIHANKNRTDGSVTRHVALMNFNARTDSYLPGYTLGRLTDRGSVFSELPREAIPHWARSAVPPEGVEDEQQD
jgi:replicative DNA helicase